VGRKFAELNNITWKPPKYRIDEKLPFLPTEGELDALISSSGKKLSNLLLLLKETGLRLGEALKLEWVNLDPERNTLTVTSEKHGKPRVFKVSGRVQSMINMLPKNGKRIFGTMKENSCEQLLWTKRMSLARKLQNPRFEQIHFHSFRHWKATMEYAKTKDILHVMQVLGHRNIKNTLIYTQLINFESDDFRSATANTASEAEKLVQTGFEYVCTTPENIMLFRKRK
jgi:integrase